MSLEFVILLFQAWKVHLENSFGISYVKLMLKKRSIAKIFSKLSLKEASTMTQYT